MSERLTLKRLIINSLLRLKLDGVLVFLFRFGLKEVKVPGISTKPNPICILALSAERFRGELEALVATGEVRVFKLNFVFQTGMITSFYKRSPLPAELFHTTDSFMAEYRRKYQAFLGKVLRSLQKRHNIRILIGANMIYRQDIDWGIAAKLANCQYVVLYRGGMITTKGMEQDLCDRFASYGKFHGDLILVQNELTRQLLIRAKYVDENQVIVTGAGRMDTLIDKIKAYPKKVATNKQVALFSFSHATGFTGVGMSHHSYTSKFDGAWSRDGKAGFVELFEKTHVAVAKYAKKHPEVAVVIKTKWGHNWVDMVDSVLAKHGLKRSEIPNLKITWDENPHDIILQSDVICSFGSTTLLEAALADKPIIMPFFSEALDPEIASYVPFADLKELFSVARTEDEIGELIDLELMKTVPNLQRTSLRKKAFEHYIAPLDGNSSKHYVDAMRQISQ